MQNIDYLPVVNTFHIVAWKFGVHEFSWGCQCADPADRLLWTQTSLNRIKDRPGPDPLQPQSGLSYWYQCQSPGAVPSEMLWPLRGWGDWNFSAGNTRKILSRMSTTAQVRDIYTISSVVICRWGGIGIFFSLYWRCWVLGRVCDFLFF